MNSRGLLTVYLIYDRCKLLLIICSEKCWTTSPNVACIIVNEIGRQLTNLGENLLVLLKCYELYLDLGQIIPKYQVRSFLLLLISNTDFIRGFDRNLSFVK